MLQVLYVGRWGLDSFHVDLSKEPYEDKVFGSCVCLVKPRILQVKLNSSKP